ncbi:MAG: hypothetical protein IKF78_07215 [Atopobiaceae bacterium]|nr:hypothetical protein [Atopobiaceae bacterium]
MYDVERYEGGIEYVNSGNLFEDAHRIIDRAQHAAHQSVNIFLVARNWLLGKRIAEEELAGADCAGYGKQTIKQLSDELNEEYGGGFDQSTLYKFVRFYREFPNILDSVSPKSWPLLSWTHYRVLLQVDDAEARAWYERGGEGNVERADVAAQRQLAVLLSHACHAAKGPRKGRDAGADRWVPGRQVRVCEESGHSGVPGISRGQGGDPSRARA